MRLNSRNLDYRVTVAADSIRPVRLLLGGLVYAMELDEALDLATKLADTITELRKETTHG